MICVIDESSPHNWAASDFSEHWLSIISNIWNNYGIHKQRAGVGGGGVGGRVPSSLGIQRRAGQFETEVSQEFTRRNVNSTDGWVSKALCCPEEVWSRAAGPPSTGPDYVEMGSALGGKHSSARAVLLQCMKVTSEASCLCFRPPDVLTYRLAHCWVCRWCTRDAQNGAFLFSKPFQSFPCRATPRVSATGLKSNNGSGETLEPRCQVGDDGWERLEEGGLIKKRHCGIIK